MDTGFEKIDSRSELREQLRRSQPSVMLGDDDQSPNEYFIASLPGCSIGICSQGQGVRPSVLRDPAGRTAWIGYNSNLANLNTGECRMNFIIQLDSVFFSILCQMQDGSVIVIHELGATRISSSGSVLWSVSTDVLTGFEDGGEIISLTTEESSIRIDKECGKHL